MQKKYIILEYDLKKINYDEKNAKKIIKELSRIRKKADLLHRQLKINLINGNSNYISDKYKFFIIKSINAVQIEDKKARYDYLYDEICYYLDHVCISNNLCDFKNDKCFAKRDTNMKMGCCHHFPDKKWGMLYQKKLVECENLSSNGCTTKSIGCKLFMCDEVNKKGYKFTVYNVLLIRYFFNFIQKIIIKMSVFETKENIMRKLLLWG